MENRKCAVTYIKAALRCCDWFVASDEVSVLRNNLSSALNILEQKGLKMTVNDALSCTEDGNNTPPVWQRACVVLAGEVRNLRTELAQFNNESAQDINGSTIAVDDSF